MIFFRKQGFYNPELMRRIIENFFENKRCRKNR